MLLDNNIDGEALNTFYRDINDLVGTKSMLKIFNYYRGAQITIPSHSINAEIVEYQAMLQLIDLINSKSIKARLLSLMKEFYNKNHTLIKDVVVKQSANIARYKEQLSSLKKHLTMMLFYVKNYQKKLKH